MNESIVLSDNAIGECMFINDMPRNETSIYQQVSLHQLSHPHWSQQRDFSTATHSICQYVKKCLHVLSMRCCYEQMMCSVGVKQVKFYRKKTSREKPDMNLLIINSQARLYSLLIKLISWEGTLNSKRNTGKRGTTEQRNEIHKHRVCPMHMSHKPHPINGVSG